VIRTSSWLLSSIALAGCGASYAAESAPSYGDVATTGSAGAAYGGYPPDEARGEVMAASMVSEESEGNYEFDEDDSGGGDDVLRAEPGRAAPPPAPPTEPGSATADFVPQDGAQYAQNQPNPNGNATDAVDTSGPLLIYTGDFTLGVYAVGETQERIIEAIRQLGGHISQRNDAMLVVRVPASRFEAAIESIEQAGDVLARNVQATDVSEEFRDIEIRIRNAEAMRDRLEQLLARANDVTAALSIERELQRLTEYIETMKGRQRFLADRISLSTLTIRFQALGTEGSGRPDGFALPFPWLDEIGLSNLMRLQ
jgi:hypothetical protein